MRSLDDLDAVLAFFEARRGRLIGFRWKDWLDHGSGPPSATPAPGDQVIGTGDGATAAFDLVKRYGDIDPVVRPVTKPVAGSVRVALDGVEQTGFAVDTTTGRVTLSSPPASGVTVTAGFAFDVPVRFDTDRLEVNLAAFEAGEIPSIPILEVRL